jgi:hypothetical protein
MYHPFNYDPYIPMVTKESCYLRGTGPSNQT